MVQGSSEIGRVLHPSAAPQVEDRLASRHIRFSFEANLRVDAVRDVEGNQVRLSEHRAPKERVDRYAEQMKRGAVFPAIVVNERYELIDGNTRWAATRRNGRETIPAYVCQDVSALQARSLSVELNQTHGLSMAECELRAFVTSAVQDGQVLDATAYARMTGVRASRLARWVAATHFQMRATREGIAADRLARLSDSVQAALQVIKLRRVFVAATELTIDARVPAGQLKAIVTEANAASSEEAALQVVADARAARADEIRAMAAGFKGPSRRSAGSALHIGGLLRFEVADLLDVAPEKQDETFERLSVLRGRLDGVLSRAAQEWDLSARADADATRDLAEVGAR